MKKWQFLLLFIAFAVQSQHHKEWTKAAGVNMNSPEVKALKSSIDKNYLVNPEITVSQSKTLLQLAEKSKDTFEIGYAANAVGLAYLHTKKIHKSLEYIKFAIEMDLIVNSDLLATHYRNLGIVYYGQGYINHAIDQYNLGLKAVKKGDRMESWILNTIGYCCMKIKDYPKAVYYFQKTIDVAHQNKDYEFLKAYYEGLVDAQLEIDLPAAKKNLDIGAAYEMTDSTGEKATFDHAYLLLYANYYLKIKDYKLSESYALRALRGSFDIKNTQVTILAYMVLAKLKMANNQIIQARNYAEKAFELGKKENWFLDLKEVTDLLLVIYEKESPNKKPFEVFEFHRLISDSLSQNTLKEYELRAAFEGKMIQDSIKAANQKMIITIAYNQHIEKQKLMIWGAVLSSVLLLGMVIFIFKNYKNKKKINEIISKENIDLTQQKQKIENHVSELLDVVESARDFIAYSKNEPVFSYINNAGKKLLHIPAAMQNYYYADIFDPETLKFINTAIKVSEMNGFSSGEVTVKLSDGSSIPILLSIVCHRNEAAEIDQFSMIGQQISDLKNYQEKIMLQNALLQKVNRELDRFVYSISHDLRAPLISVVGVLEILEEEFYPTDSDFQLYLSMLRSGLMNTDDIIKNILSYSLNSRESVKITEIQMSEIIEKTLENFAEVISRKNITVAVNIEQLHPFYNDAQRIETLLHNVVDNAIKYQRPDENDKKINIVFTSGQKECTLVITDNGIGIEKGYEEQIFEMFYRGSSLSSGSGLGLYIVKQIGDLIEAKVAVHTIPDDGTQFKIVFSNLKSKFRNS